MFTCNYMIRYRTLTIFSDVIWHNSNFETVDCKKINPDCGEKALNKIVKFIVGMAR